MRTAVLLLAFVMALPAPAPLMAQNGKALNYEKIVELVKLKLPDARLAGEISSRGVSPLLRRQELDSLRQQGMGEQALAALERYVMTSPLTLVFDPPAPGLKVTLNGVSYEVPAAGRVTITGLEPGAYAFTTEKLPAYPPATHQVSLVEGGTESTIKLTALTGHLKITTIDRAKITLSPVAKGAVNKPIEISPPALPGISGIDETLNAQNGDISVTTTSHELELPTGEYSLMISTPGYKMFTGKTSITAGTTTELNPELAINTLIFSMENLLGNIRTHDDEISFKRKMSTLIPGILRSFAGTGSIQLAPTTRTSSMRNGQLVFTDHESAFYLQPFVNRAPSNSRTRTSKPFFVLHINSEGIAGGERFPWAQIQSVLVGQERGGWVINFNVKSGKNLDKTKRVQLTTGSSKIVDTQAVRQLNSPASAQYQLSALAWFINELKNQMGK